MSWKNISQLSLADSLIVEHQALFELDGIHDLIDWTNIEDCLKKVYNKPQGNVAYHPLMMFKALLLQSWYCLSDPALEKQLARDLMFRRFVGLSIADSVPDHSTIWRFRQAIDKANLVDKLLVEVNKLLAQQGLLIKAGSVSIIDATVIEANRSRPHKGADGNNTQDTEAAWNVKTAADGKLKSTYGYKAHINVDEDGFIKSTEFTSGNIHDSQVFTQLLEPSDTAAYADAAYPSEKTSQWLAAHGIENRLLFRAYRNKPLTPEQKQLNRLRSSTRSIVERVFGLLKLHYGMGKARYLGLSRNRVRFGMMCIAYNVKRGMAFVG